MQWWNDLKLSIISLYTGHLPFISWTNGKFKPNVYSGQGNEFPIQSSLQNRFKLIFGLREAVYFLQFYANNKSSSLFYTVFTL